MLQLPVPACLVTIAAASLIAGGCAAPKRGENHESVLTEMAASPRKVTVLRGGTLEPVEWPAVVSDAAGADAVLIGELHEQVVGQAFEGAFFADVLEKAPNAGAAMEFFERDQQAAVDDYLSGVTDLATFRTATRRPTPDRSTGHQSIIDASKQAKRPVIAANAPRRYVRLARTDGFDRLKELGAEQRRLFAVPDELPTGKYRDDFFAFMRGDEGKGPAHGEAKPKTQEEIDAENKRIEASFRSQSVWDATMGQSVANAPGIKPVVLVVGKFHVADQGGTYQELRRRQPSWRILTITQVPATSSSDEQLTKLKNEADYLVLIGPAPEE